MDLKKLQEDGDYFRAQLGSDRGFIVTFDTITPESAEAGDFADNGFEDYDSCEPDEFDTRDGLSAVDKAVRYLRDKGATSASGSHFHPSAYYSTEFDTEDYQTGEEVRYSYHPENFSEEEQREIFRRIVGK